MGFSAPVFLPLLFFLHGAVFFSSVAPEPYQEAFAYHESGTPCYDDLGKPKRCIPEFGNAAYGLEVEATNTCGIKDDSHFCIQTSAMLHGSCGYVCRAGDHPPSYLTDLNNPRNLTWWQSETMEHNIQYPNMVNLTLHLKKAYDITYVRVLFYSPRPESFAIYKRTREDGPWIPFQFYSGTCRDTYGLDDQKYAHLNEVTSAICTSEFSEISPLTGGNIAFSTLEARQFAAYNFSNDPQLQEWVTATDIRIVLNRMNTFGDEVFGDVNTVHRSYFYAITDIAVGARCKCNGHASECVLISSEGRPRKVCRCEHNTAGDDCEKCAPFYQDSPWRRASDDDAHECKSCNCNGYSDRCFFDPKLYETTGHGGHCIDCTGDRAGANCERCRDNYYQQGDDRFCSPCNCNETGSVSLQCNSDGKCKCRPGVTGDKCDRCKDNFYDFGVTGCKECRCLTAGSHGNRPSCDQTTGMCVCKENVEGKECRRCKLGYFNLDEENEFGCTPCFCYEHSSDCGPANGYSKVAIESIFSRNSEKWSGFEKGSGDALVQFNPTTQVIGVTAQGRKPVYFVAPERFLGDKRASYNQNFEFKLRIGENGAAPAGDDIILEGAGLSVSQTIFGQGNSIPSASTNLYVFRLHEHPDYGWQPTLSAKKFMRLLSNIESIKIRGTYNPKGLGFLDDVRLSTARRGAIGPVANWVERCNCPEGYVGQFCESCAPGYRHQDPTGGPFSPCVPCDCNKHADICDPDSGRCICQHNTAGENCDRCAHGYYGNALEGTPDDCKVCPCPAQGACMLLPDDTVLCVNCPTGYSGARCDVCSDGYYGEEGDDGNKVCKPCDCNTNVDPNAVGNCDKVTGECLKCIYNTAGSHCDQCLTGYYGDALAKHKGDCKRCRCFPDGTEYSDGGFTLCDQLTGQCKCKPHVTGINCDQCAPGYYNIASGKGCEPCDCNYIGSANSSCDVITGQCYCQPGVTGRQCNNCKDYHYGFSSQGCTSCDCDEIGSVSLQCDGSGQCPCLENVEGKQCDRCKENKYDKQRGCVDCPPCYTLVQDAVNAHRKNLEELKNLLKKLVDSPTIINNAEFDEKLKLVQDRVQQLSQDAWRAAGGYDKELTSKLNELREKLQNFDKSIEKINNDAGEMEQLVNTTAKNVTHIQKVIDDAKNDLQKALDYVLTEGVAVLNKAENRSAEFGQQDQQMTNIAQKARENVNRQIEEAEETRKIAEKAANISQQAYELTIEARERQVNASNEMKALEDELHRAKDILEQTASRAKVTHDHASAAYHDAFNLYTELKALPTPEVDSTGIIERAKNQEETGNEYLKEVLRLKDVFNTESLIISEDIAFSEQELKEGIKLQQRTDELLADAEAAKDKAANAVSLGDKTLKDAHETLDTLKGFDQQVQESKSKAKESLDRLPEIKTMLEEAREKTTNANEALAGAEVNAQNAKKIAEEAQNEFAEKASSEADEILQTSKTAQTEAAALTDQTEKLATNVVETDKKLMDIEKAAMLDLQYTKEANEKVGIAQANANKASQQVKQALSEIEQILKDLSESSDIDEEHLKQLEDKLNQAEQEFRESDLDKKLKTLEEAKYEQALQVKKYEDELKNLRADVDNIRIISEALPKDACFKRIRLEP